MYLLFTWGGTYTAICKVHKIRLRSINGSMDGYIAQLSPREGGLLFSHGYFYQLPRLPERGYILFSEVATIPANRSFADSSKTTIALYLPAPSWSWYTNEFTTFISRETVPLRTLLLIESTLETSGPPLSPWQASRPPSAYPAHIISVKMSTLNILESYENEVSISRSLQRAIKIFWNLL